jgi:anti-sigma regulatory factor (Ser/Thr protein kinase)
VSRFLVVPVTSAEDVTLARYTVQAAHALSGATVVLDLAEAPASASADWEELLAEFARTTSGNRQDFVVLASHERLEELAPRTAATTKPERQASLVDCLQALGPDPLAPRYGIDLTLPARMEYLAPVRTYLSGIVRQRHGSADAFRIEILVDELCLNAVENSPSGHNSYDVSFRLADGPVELDVSNVFDDTIDSERIMQRRLQTFDASGDYLGERGRGLFLIARLADGLEIKSLPGDRICVSVRKQLGPTVHEGPSRAGAHGADVGRGAALREGRT